MVYHVQRGHVVHDHFLGSCKASNCSRYTWHHCKLACFVASEKLRMSLQAISSLKSQNTSLMDSPLLGSCQTRNENEGFDQWKKKSWTLSESCIWKMDEHGLHARAGWSENTNLRGPCHEASYPTNRVLSKQAMVTWETSAMLQAACSVSRKQLPGSTIIIKQWCTSISNAMM